MLTVNVAAILFRACFKLLFAAFFFFRVNYMFGPQTMTEVTLLPFNFNFIIIFRLNF